MSNGFKHSSVQARQPASAKTGRLAVVYLILAVSTIVIYWPVRNFEFLNFDDTKYVSDNPYVNSGITRDGLAWAFTDSMSYWHPLTWLSHMLDCQLFGINPGPHHLMNLFFHIANTLLLFTILMKMTSALWRSFFVAALFAFHPLHVESVAWIVERKDVLSGLFWMLTILVYLRYLKNRTKADYLCALVMFALALMSKPTVATLPFVLLLLDYWPLKRFSGLSSPQSRKIFYNLIVEKIPFFILSAVSVYVVSASTQRLDNTVSTQTVSMSLRIENAIVSYVKYVVMHIWPGALSPFYPYPHSIPLWQITGAALFILVLLAFAAATAKTRPYFIIGVLWFLGTMLPSIGLVQAGLWPAVADRFTYLPSVGIFIVASWGFYDLFKNYRHRNAVMTVLSLAVLSAFAVVTRTQLRHWQNTVSLFEHALKVNKDNFLAHSSLGYVLYEQGKRDEAIAHYYRALSIEPDDSASHVNLGAALAAKGRFDEAEKHFTEAIRINPRMAEAYTSLAKLYAQQGKIKQAADCYQKALKITPRDFNTHNALGVVLVKLSLYDDGITQFKEAVQLKPDFAEAHANLGHALLEQKKFDEAIKHLTISVKLEPDKPAVQNNLAVAFEQKGKFDNAVYHYRQAVRIKPDWAVPANSLAWLLAVKKNAAFYDPKEAVSFAQKACRLTNNSEPAVLDTLAVAYAANGQFAEAVDTAQKALNLAKALQQDALADEIQKHLNLFKAGQPYRETSS